MKLIKKVFNYCVYRVEAVYKKMGMGDHIEQGYSLMFVSFTFYAMALTECLLSVFNMKINACMSTESTIFVTQNNQGGTMHYTFVILLSINNKNDKILNFVVYRQ